MRTFTLLFILTCKFAFAQNAEQRALTFLAKNIHGQELRNSNGTFIVSDDSTKIWYYLFVLDTKTNLMLENAVSSSLDKFDKIVHSFNDIFVITKKSSTSVDNKQIVPFEIYTKYGLSFLYIVTFEGNEPKKLIRTIKELLITAVSRHFSPIQKKRINYLFLLFLFGTGLCSAGQMLYLDLVKKVDA